MLGYYAWIVVTIYNKSYNQQHLSKSPTKIVNNNVKWENIWLPYLYEYMLNDKSEWS